MAWFRQGISAMQSLDASALLPLGFPAVDALSDGDSAVITIRAMSASSPRPSCGAISDRVHSRYPRRVADLPIAGQRVALALHARRFCCDALRCARRIFTERFDDNILKPWAAAPRSARSDRLLPRARPGRSTGGEFRAPLERCRSAATPRCAPCAGAAARASRPRRSLASTTVLGAATNATER